MAGGISTGGGEALATASGDALANNTGVPLAASSIVFARVVDVEVDADDRAATVLLDAVLLDTTGPLPASSAAAVTSPVPGCESRVAIAGSIFATNAWRSELAPAPMSTL